MAIDCEFECEDCGTHVYSFGRTEGDRYVCYTCHFLREHPGAPDEVKKLLLGKDFEHYRPKKFTDKENANG